ncbi:FixH family protein [Altererythrobacter sp. CC-YST694]|uniref:FixH family protein n=1 Tax=Altererythrobacter sp. CC-YST694 TaxID=2755038 RepID=UPI001D0282DA|nr:FixH family protein [Altererythrobacter sp. CC-YST694]MCB5426009.1 FixH family protein [Altererythrobacter sp. CC-YST694]
MDAPIKGGRFTGWHATAIFIAFFGTVGTVNVVMARYATSTFGGVVVENSYVASQEFNGWLDRAAKSKELGWQADAARTPQGRVAVTLAGAPDDAQLDGDARHPLGRLDDVALTFTRQADGSYLSRETLPEGRWTLRLAAKAGTDSWRGEEELK